MFIKDNITNIIFLIYKIIVKYYKILLTLTKINVIILLEREEKYNMKKIIRFIKDRDIFIIFALFVGILTYMVGLRDRAEAEAFENEQNKIKIEEMSR